MSYDNVIKGLVTRLEKLERGNRGLKGGGDYPALPGYVSPLQTLTNGFASTASGSYTALYHYVYPDQNPSVMAVFEASVTAGTAALIIWDISQGNIIDYKEITNTSTATITMYGDPLNFSYMTMRTIQLQGKILSGGGTLSVRLNWFGGKLL